MTMTRVRGCRSSCCGANHRTSARHVTSIVRPASVEGRALARTLHRLHEAPVLRLVGFDRLDPAASLDALVAQDDVPLQKRTRALHAHPLEKQCDVLRMCDAKLGDAGCLHVGTSYRCLECDWAVCTVCVCAHVGIEAGAERHGA